LVTASANGTTLTITADVDGAHTAFSVVATDADDESHTVTDAEAVEGTLGSDGNDTVYAGEGADVIFLGDGANTVDLTEATSAADVVHFTNAVDDQQTIVSFTINKDTLDFNGMDLTDGEAAVDIAADAATAEFGAGAVTVFANGADGTGSGLESVIVDYTDLVDVAAFIEAGLDIDSGEEGIVIINDLVGDNAYIYALDGTADANITSADLDLIGIVSNIGSTPLDANDIVA
jgi:NAD(P)-dependent dehydrogenase (short-subunit alcohol dehydrogenase family)